ncbi:Uncharacterised protein [Paenibacillus thiaminolyticus]|nr:Uncharacterised protein [Paenibacillus thiaminolyticus]
MVMQDRGERIDISRKKSRSKHKSRKKRGVTWAECEPLQFDQDESFYFIVGYTDGGAPYGINGKNMRRSLRRRLSGII